MISFKGLGRVLLATIALFSLSCDELRVVPRDTGPMGEPVEQAVRVLISHQGLEAIWSESAAQGLELQEEADSPLPEPVLARLGPLEQRLPLARVETFPKQALTTVLFHFDSLQVVVPVRLGSGGETVVCRWQLSATSAVVAADVAVVESSRGTSLSAVTSPQVQLTSSRIDAVGSCPTDLDSASDPAIPSRNALLAAMEVYVERALSRATRALLEQSPLELTGVVEGGLELERQQRLSSKEGVMRLFGKRATSPSGALVLSDQGLSLTLDYALLFDAAPCAPLLELDALRAAGQASLDPQVLRARDADIGLSLSRPLLERLAQVMTRAGFFCSGLEGIGTSVESLSTSDVLFSQINLEDALFGERVLYSVSPGSLPRLTLRPSSGTLDLRWDALQIELYVELFGAQVLAARLEIAANIALRPEPDLPGTMALRADSVSISSARLTSDWVTAAPDEAALQAWARRVVLLVIGERILLPLPVEPALPLSLVEAQVREDDLLLLLSL